MSTRTRRELLADVGKGMFLATLGPGLSRDLGLSAVRKFDCEAWIPTQVRYRELTSTSNCTDFQSRRLDTRGRFPDGIWPVATLNGTLCAMPRTIIALLETHQQADGSVRVPKALQSHLGGREVLEPIAS